MKTKRRQPKSHALRKDFDTSAASQRFSISGTPARIHTLNRQQKKEENGRKNKAAPPLRTQRQSQHNANS